MTAVWPASSSAPSPSTRSSNVVSVAPSDGETPGVGRGAGRIGLTDHGAHIDQERQRFVLADDVAAGVRAVGEVAGDVELDPGPGLRTGESLVPAGDHATLAQHH